MSSVGDKLTGQHSLLSKLVPRLFKTLASHLHCLSGRQRVCIGEERQKAKKHEWPQSSFSRLVNKLCGLDMSFSFSELQFPHVRNKRIGLISLVPSNSKNLLFTDNFLTKYIHVHWRKSGTCGKGKDSNENHLASSLYHPEDNYFQCLCMLFLRINFTQHILLNN